MTRLPCLAVATGLWALGAAPAGAADDCAAVLPELRQAAQRPAIDEMTRDNIHSLVSDAEGLCEEGEQAKARTKFANVHDLLEGDFEEKDGVAD